MRVIIVPTCTGDRGIGEPPGTRRVGNWLPRAKPIDETIIITDLVIAAGSDVIDNCSTAVGTACRVYR